MMRNIYAVVACVSLATGATVTLAKEAAYPSKPIRLVVGYSAGGSTDIVARLLANEMQKSLGVPVIVDNKPSTGGVVGALTVAKAAPDGYTVMLAASGPMVINPAVDTGLSYNTRRDFRSIALVASLPLIIGVKDGARFTSVKDLVTLAKAQPDKSNYSASSSAFMLATELLKEKTGLVAEHIPYKGSAEAVNAVSAGDVTFSLMDPGPAAGAINGKLIRPIAVTSKQRMPIYPNVPTLKEVGVDLEISFWLGLFAPANTPQPVVDALEKAARKAVEDKQVRQRIESLGLIPDFKSAADLASRIEQELPMWAELARQKNLKVR